MKISEIYKKYKINKGLQEHMIRVAAAAQQICDNATIELDIKNIVTGCLVHDMGNLIKSKMDSFPEFFEPEGVEYWIKVKDEMIAQYGEDEHEATIAMVTDMNLTDEAVFYFNAIGTENTQRVYETGTLGEKIATYCDMRVGPFGIILLADRMNDLRERYIVRNKPGFSAEDIDLREKRLVDMEEEIFTNSKINPAAITDESTAEIQAALYDFKVK